MTEHPVERRAQTQVPIHPPIAQRWSPRAFEPGSTVTTEQVIGLLEAGRWAATWGRRQPVRFVIGLRRAGAERLADEPRGDTRFETLSSLLKRGNAYANAAGALILVCADEGEDENTARYALVDAGAAMANMAIEAVARGLVSHPMAGFDVEGARSAFAIPAGVRPVAIVAAGSLADSATVSPEITERDALPRSRAPLSEVAFAGRWAQPWSLGD